METIIRSYISEAIDALYMKSIDSEQVQVQETRREFEGDFTVIVFPLTRYSSRSPEVTGDEIGKYLVSARPEIISYNVIKGFLNLVISPGIWTNMFREMAGNVNFGTRTVSGDSPTVVIEYSSPNTNKPLHLGHIRNNLLGFSLCRIAEANGLKVVKTNIVNDRGIHICKSMVAWLKYGNGETPSSSGLKGDHLVGKYYVLFEKEFRNERERLISEGVDPESVVEVAPLMREAREMLRRWEAGDSETVSIWKMMNEWVYEGFDETYSRLGVSFDKIYYESDTYLRGREIVREALSEGLVYSESDGSVWADLSDDGLDRKILLRADGTAVYITQDLGTAVIRHEEYQFDRSVYVVGNEQNYHFQVLKALLARLGYPWASELYHFSYGMVELPEGKMKSREGKVVDADQLIDEMIATAETMSEELGKLDAIEESRRREIYRKIGLAALKYFILKVDPKKNMTFNPEESVDFNGNTGPFIQYTFARIMSVLRRADGIGYRDGSQSLSEQFVPNGKELSIIKAVRRFSHIIASASDEMNPSLIANYVYDLAKEFNQFYHDFSILNESEPERRFFRIELSRLVSGVIGKGMWLLGIEMPERM